MNCYKHQRSHSLKSSKSTSKISPLFSILKFINPTNQREIDLEDMNSLLINVPEEQKLKVQQIFQRYIISTKKFWMPISTFLKMYDGNIADSHRKLTAKEKEHAISRINSYLTQKNSNQNLKHKRGVSFFDINTNLKQTTKKLGNERNFITYDESFADPAIYSSFSSGSNKSFINDSICKEKDKRMPLCENVMRSCLLRKSDLGELNRARNGHKRQNSLFVN
ncbi:unnamed protein product [Blepharisma stoltei]|uniref:Uncharacterized protein n=1 Tax=Blepharisma stoltei TaxID=1481888 RepID=A0AAU9IWK6_9CILI|nr:unnamed protein product [Blepharisma stoltei]